MRKNAVEGGERNVHVFTQTERDIGIKREKIRKVEKRSMRQ